MGNKVAREFHATKLGRGWMDGTEAELIAPEMVIHGKNSSTVVEEEICQGLVGQNNQLLARRHFVDVHAKEVLFRADHIQQANKCTPRSIASDRDGFVLYVDNVIIMPDGQKRTMIYKTCPAYPNQPVTADNVKMLKQTNKQLYLAAVIFDCQHQANQNAGAACAILCVVTGQNKLDDTGFELQDLYRAIKIPKVKNGVLVIDVMNGQAVGKSAAVPKGHFGSALSSSSSSDPSTSTCSRRSSFGMSSMSTSSSSTSAAAAAAVTNEESMMVYEIAVGAEAAAVIAVASSLF
jgi:hypothetical protein